VRKTRLSAPRILVVAQTVYQRDPRVRRATLALTRAGYAVDVICQAEPHEQNVRSARLDGARLFFVPIQRLRGGKSRYAKEYAGFLVASFLLATRLFIGRGYTIVYVHTMPDILVFAALIPKVFGAKVILDVHDPFPETMREKFGYSSKHPVVRAALLAERMSHRYADQIITVHDGMKHMLARTGHIGNIAVVMNVAPSAQFTQSTAAPPGNRFVISYTGTLTAHYGLDLALDAEITT